MTIECHNVECKFHGVHVREDGPFCFEDECREAEWLREEVAKYKLESAAFRLLAEKNLAEVQQVNREIDAAMAEAERLRNVPIPVGIRCSHCGAVHKTYTLDELLAMSERGDCGRYTE